MLPALCLVQELHFVDVDFEPFTFGGAQLSQGAGQNSLLRQVCDLTDAVTVKLLALGFLLPVHWLLSRDAERLLVHLFDVVEELSHLGLRELSL